MKYHKKTKTHLNPSSKILVKDNIDSGRNLIDSEKISKEYEVKQNELLNLNQVKCKDDSDMNIKFSNQQYTKLIKEKDQFSSIDKDSLYYYKSKQGCEFLKDDDFYHNLRNSFSQISSHIDNSNNNLDLPLPIELDNIPKIPSIEIKKENSESIKQLEKDNLIKLSKYTSQNKLASSSQNNSRSYSNLYLNAHDLELLSKDEDLSYERKKKDKENVNVNKAIKAQENNNHNENIVMLNPKLIMKKEENISSNIVIIDDNYNSSGRNHKEDYNNNEKNNFEHKRIVNFKLSTEEENFNTKKQNSSFVNNSLSQSQMNKQSSITIKDFKRRKSLFKEIESEIKQSLNENKELEFLSDYKRKLLEPEDEKYTQFIYNKIQIDEFCSLIMNIAGMYSIKFFINIFLNSDFNSSFK